MLLARDGRRVETSTLERVGELLCFLGQLRRTIAGVKPCTSAVVPNALSNRSTPLRQISARNCFPIFPLPTCAAVSRCSVISRIFPPSNEVVAEILRSRRTIETGSFVFGFCGKNPITFST